MMRYKWDVFLSYSTKDAKVCKSILQDLERLGFRCWHDESRVGPGMRIREAIEEGIRNSACIVVLFSVNSLRSRWVLNELDAAMLREIKERRTLVIPVLLGRVDTDLLPTDLQGKHFVDLRFNFESQYRNRRDLLFRSVRLVVPSSNSTRRLTRLGPEAMAYFFSWKHRSKHVREINPKWWDALIDILLKEASGDESQSVAFSQFRDRYGNEGFRRLLMFIFDIKAIDLRGGFTEPQLDDAMDEAIWLIRIMAAHEYAITTGQQGIELRITKDREFNYRIDKYGP